MSEAAGSPGLLQTTTVNVVPEPRSPLIAHRVSVVIPARNEAKNLQLVLSALPDNLHQVILVDGHSVDGTVATAVACRPDIEVIVQTRQGKGNALACGFEAATGDIIVMLDADGSADPAEIPLFVDALVSGADVAKGTRFARGGASDDITGPRRVGNAALKHVVNVLYGTHHTDLCYGYMAFWRRMLEHYRLPPTDLGALGAPNTTGDPVALNGDGFEIETLLTIRAIASRAKITEVGSIEKSRRYGRSNLHAVKDGVRVARTIIAERRGLPAMALPYGDQQSVPATVPRQRTATERAAPQHEPTVSIVIACYSDDRWSSLTRSIDSAINQTLGGAEVVVVVDRNEGLLKRLRAHYESAGPCASMKVLPNVRSGGASGARNTGAFAATGDLVAFLDDDAWAETTWLSDIVPVFADTTVVGVGGGVDPIWEDHRPTWFPPEFSWVVGTTSPLAGPEPVPVRNVWACNMVLHRSDFVAVGGFREDFGKLNNVSEPEDTELCIRVAANAPGREWVRIGAGRVHHAVPAQRGTASFFLRRCWNEGVGKASLAAVSEARSAVLSSERDYLYCELPQGLFRHLASCAKGDLDGLTRASFIVIGATATCLGFAQGRMRGKTIRHREAASTPHTVPATLPVLMYHSIPIEPRRRLGPLQVPLDELKRHLALLSDEGWELVGLTTALAMLRQDPSRRVAALTFDDGYADFLGALAVFDAVGATATLYVPTAHIGTKGITAASSAALLSWDQLAQVAGRGVEIGSHAHHHRPMDVLAPAVLHDEVRRSKDELERHLQLPVRSFCFPHGYTSPRVRAALVEAGFENACTVGRRVATAGDDVYAVPRLQARPGMSDQNLMRTIECGEPGWTPAAKRALQPAWRLTRLGADRVLGHTLT